MNRGTPYLRLPAASCGECARPACFPSFQGSALERAIASGLCHDTDMYAEAIERPRGSFQEVVLRQSLKSFTRSGAEPRNERENPL